MKLLTLCFPTFYKHNELHLNSKGDHVVLAPDEFHVELMQNGWEVDVASIGPPTDLPLFRSKLRLKSVEDITIDDYDVIWHMFRDPTQPEVIEMLSESVLDTKGKRVLNHMMNLRNHYKQLYLPTLAKYGLSAEITHDVRYDSTWIHYSGSYVSPDGRWISSNAFNNNRGDYPDRGPDRVVTRFIDNRHDGLYSIVRFGYALGEGFKGFRYWHDRPAFKTGEARKIEPYFVPEVWHSPLTNALNELGCDICHVEAVPTEDRIWVFDVNPYPTANGTTLSVITSDLAKILTAKMM